MTAPELARKEQARLLVAGIEACGLDVEAELDRLCTLPPAKHCFIIQGYQLAGLSAQTAKLPGAGDAR